MPFPTPEWVGVHDPRRHSGPLPLPLPLPAQSSGAGEGAGAGEALAPPPDPGWCYFSAVPALLGPLIGFVLGVALGWVRAGTPEREEEDRAPIAHGTAVAALFA